MINLPTLLRAEADEWDDPDPTISEQACVPLMRQAADEITRLRAALAASEAEVAKLREGMRKIAETCRSVAAAGETRGLGLGVLDLYGDALIAIHAKATEAGR